MKNIHKIAILIILCGTLMPGCSPSTRLAHLLEHHPELMIPDTLFIQDTIPLPFIQADTSWHIDNLNDTAFLTKDRLEVTLQRLLDTIYLQGKCKADTIYLEHQIPVEKIKLVKKDKLDQLISQIPWIAAGIIVLILLVIVLLIRFK